MKAKFLFMDQYYMFAQDNQYYMVDMGYLSWLVTLFPPLCFFIKYPVYEISRQDFVKIEEYVKKIYDQGNNKFNIKSFVIIGLLSDVFLALSVKTSIFIALIINLIIISISCIIFNKNFANVMKLLFGYEYDAYFPSYKKISSKIVFKFNKRQSLINFGLVYGIQIFVFGIFAGLFHSLISNGKINLVYGVMVGVGVAMIIKASSIGCVKNLTAEMKE